MKKVTANQPFYGSKDEKQWTPGETRELSTERAEELIKLGLVDEAKGGKTETQSSAGASSAPVSAPKAEKEADKRKTKEDKEAAARATKETK